MNFRPHFILFATGIVIFVMALLIDDTTADASVYDAFFVVGLTEYYFVLAFILLFVGVLYWTFRKYFYSRLLAWVHVVIHVLSVLMAASIPVLADSFPSQSYRLDSTFTVILAFVFVIWILSQVVFIYHIVTGFQREGR